MLRLPEKRRSIGKYGRMYRDYLKETHPAMYNDLVLIGKLWTYLADLNEQLKAESKEKEMNKVVNHNV